MKRKHNEGFTLLETLIAIVVLGVVVVPVCSSLIMSFRINAKAEQLLRDQLAVSSAVETLMAEGLTVKEETGSGETETVICDRGGKLLADRFPDLVVSAVLKETYCDVTVKDAEGDVVVTTQICVNGEAAPDEET